MPTTPTIRRYLITAAQEEVTMHEGSDKEFTLSALPHKPFCDNLDKYAKHLGAEVLVIPYARGKYHAGGYQLNPSFARRGWKTVLNDTRLCKHLEVRLFWVSGQQINPLTGLSRFIATDRSAILGSPKQHMLPVPNQSDLPKVLLSTGTATLPSYKASRQGEIAALDHTYGFVYVETDGTTFHFRQVEADKAGNFCDLYTEVRDRKVRKATAEALILGDVHTGSHDPAVLAAGKELALRSRAKHLIVHDLFDGKSVNHHEASKYVLQAQDYVRMDLEQELRGCGDMLTYLKGFGAQVHVVKSNHDEFLDRYLDAGDYSKNPRNLRISAFLASSMSEGKDPLQEGIKRTCGTIDVHWIKRDESFKLRGWELGAHGDKGGNGSRGSYRQHRSTMGVCVTGHEHTPKKWGNVIVVGTSTFLRLKYTIGPSSWLNTHALLHSNGRVQLINVLNGTYRYGGTP